MQTDRTCVGITIIFCVGLGLLAGTLTNLSDYNAAIYQNSLLNPTLMTVSKSIVDPSNHKCKTDSEKECFNGEVTYIMATLMTPAWVNNATCIFTIYTDYDSESGANQYMQGHYPVGNNATILTRQTTMLDPDGIEIPIIKCALKYNNSDSYYNTFMGCGVTLLVLMLCITATLIWSAYKKRVGMGQQHFSDRDYGAC